MTSTRHSTCTLVRKLPTVYAGRLCLTLQRHFRVLTKFAHVESRLSGRKRQRKVVFYTPINLCDRRPCSTSVAVGLSTGTILLFPIFFSNHPSRSRKNNLRR